MWQALRLAGDAAGIEQTAIEIQQIPAPTFGEQERSDEVHRRFQALALAEVAQDQIGNVYGCRPGSTGLPGLLLAAHLDTVFPHGTDLSLQREGALLYGPGIGDNSLGVAALLHLAAILQQTKAPNRIDIWFVADVCEEGMGDLRGMRAAVDKLAGRIGSAVAIEGFGFGRIYHRAIAVRRLRIATRTQGGHSWADYGSPSAIHLLAEIAVAIAQLPVPEAPRSTLNIGIIQGGTSVNTIAEAAHLLLDLRSEDQATLEQMERSVRATIEGIRLPASATVTVDVVGSRGGGAIPPTHPLARAAATALHEAGAEIEWGSGSTDANVPLARGIPAICLGITTGANAHRMDEYIDLTNLPRGMEALVRLIWRLTCTAD
jgi:tripeptide aminopeptidase